MRKKLVSVVLSAALMFSLCATAFADPAKPELHQDFSGRVSIGDFSLFVNVQGSGNRDKGEPAVVFESGRQDDHTVWSSVQSEVAKKTETVSYDRADLGQSDPSTIGYSAISQADELHELLKKSHVKAPYVLVAHSYGDSISRVFADRYKDEVVGIVFVDGAHEDQERLITDVYKPEHRDVFIAKWKKEGGYAAILEGLKQAGETRKNGTLRDKPIVILTATEHGLGPEVEAAWQKLQKDLLTLSDKSVQIMAVGAYHYIHEERPQAVVDAIDSLNLLK